MSALKTIQRDHIFALTIAGENRNDHVPREPIRHNLRSIHALRGLAAGSVVVAHSLEHGHYGGSIALFAGRFGVEVFFVISGIVIMLAGGTTRFSASSFLMRRFFRIAPLYWATTILVMTLAVSAPAIFKSTAFELGYFIKSMLFLPDVVPGRVSDWRPMFKLGWTLNYEVFFYVVVASSFWCHDFNRRAVLILIIITAFVMMSFVIPPRTSELAFYANLNLMPFAFGVILAWLVQTKAGLVEELSRYRFAFLVAAVAAVLLALSFDWERFRMLDGHAAMTLAAVLVGLAALSFEPRIRAEGGLLNWLGDVSYSLYLLHMFVVGAIWAVLHRFHLDSGILPAALAVALVVIVVSPLSALSYYYFEMPINAVGRRSLRVKRSLALAKSRT